MIRKIVHIDEEKCTGCGLCVNACHEGAIAMVEGKARLIKDDYCDGLGDCLPACPAGAIRIQEREAAAYDEAAVKQRMEKRKQEAREGGCAAGQMTGCQSSAGAAGGNGHTGLRGSEEAGKIRLCHWPVQLRLTPVKTPAFENAHLLIAADCTAFACSDFHKNYMEGRLTLVGCPKLDPVDYSEKLAEIFSQNAIASILVLRMEVPCCGGIEFAVKKALNQCGREIPLEVVTLSLAGDVL